MLNTVSDNDLVTSFKNGDQVSFEEITNRYAGKVYNLAKRLVRSQEDAEEVLQDVFVTLYKKIASFEGRSSFSSWVYRITVNAALMKNRTNKKNDATLLNELDVEEKVSYLQQSKDGTDNISHRELLTLLEKVICYLPEEYRSVYVMRDIDGLTSKEVSELLKVSVPAVKSRLHKSRFLVRERLEKLLSYCDDNSAVDTQTLSN